MVDFEPEAFALFDGASLARFAGVVARFLQGLGRIAGGRLYVIAVTRGHD